MRQFFEFKAYGDRAQSARESSVETLFVMGRVTVDLGDVWAFEESRNVPNFFILCVRDTKFLIDADTKAAMLSRLPMEE